MIDAGDTGYWILDGGIWMASSCETIEMWLLSSIQHLATSISLVRPPPFRGFRNDVADLLRHDIGVVVPAPRDTSALPKVMSGRLIVEQSDRCSTHDSAPSATTTAAPRRQPAHRRPTGGRPPARRRPWPPEPSSGRRSRCSWGLPPPAPSPRRGRDRGHRREPRPHPPETTAESPKIGRAPASTHLASGTWREPEARPHGRTTPRRPPSVDSRDCPTAGRPALSTADPVRRLPRPATGMTRPRPSGTDNSSRSRAETATVSRADRLNHCSRRRHRAASFRYDGGHPKG